VWAHVGLRQDAPREVKEVKLRELMTNCGSTTTAPCVRQASSAATDR
jgi:hypothetical protein